MGSAAAAPHPWVFGRQLWVVLFALFHPLGSIFHISYQILVFMSKMNYGMQLLPSSLLLRAHLKIKFLIFQMFYHQRSNVHLVIRMFVQTSRQTPSSVDFNILHQRQSITSVVERHISGFRANF